MPSSLMRTDFSVWHRSRAAPKWRLPGLMRRTTILHYEEYQQQAKVGAADYLCACGRAEEAWGWSARGNEHLPHFYVYVFFHE
jgi:hypothetical protein